MINRVRALVIITFVAMIVVNILANTVPINGVTTGEVSDLYPNLFTPAGITFSIWGLIYLLLAGYTIYQSRNINKKGGISPDILNKIGVLFSISSVANALWVFAWHNNAIFLSMALMIIILVCLISIMNIIVKESLTAKEKIFIKLPFSVYFGWITVATIANMTALLVSIGWNGFGIPESTWAVIVIIIGAIIGILTVLKNKDYIYGLVIIWAYIGILIRHATANNLKSMYTDIITAVIICLVLLIAADIYVFIKKRIPYKSENPFNLKKAS